MTDIQTITQCLFEPDDIVELRCIRNKDVIQRWVYANALSAMTSQLQAWNQEGYNIYYGVCTEPGRSNNHDTPKCIHNHLSTMIPSNISPVYSIGMRCRVHQFAKTGKSQT